MNVFEIAAILTLCALAWIALGSTRHRARMMILAVGVLLLARSMTG